jgi:hypothetical protein
MNGACNQRGSDFFVDGRCCGSAQITNYPDEHSVSSEQQSMALFTLETVGQHKRLISSFGVEMGKFAEANIGCIATRVTLRGK